jgi:hypothetical protein
MILRHKLLKQRSADGTARRVVCRVKRRRRVHDCRIRLCVTRSTITSQAGARARRVRTRRCAFSCRHQRRCRIETTQTGVRLQPKDRRFCQQRQRARNGASQFVVLQPAVESKDKEMLSYQHQLANINCARFIMQHVDREKDTGSRGHNEVVVHKNLTLLTTESALPMRLPLEESIPSAYYCICTCQLEMEDTHFINISK